MFMDIQKTFSFFFLTAFAQRYYHIFNVFPIKSFVIISSLTNAFRFFILTLINAIIVESCGNYIIVFCFYSRCDSHGIVKILF